MANSIEMFVTKIFCVFLIGVLITFVKPDCEEQDLEVYDTGISSKDIKTIIERHNVYRQQIMDGSVPHQPKGIDLKHLRWDKRLAKSAQRVTDICEFEHIAEVDPRWKDKVGQNLYRRTLPFFYKNNSNWTRAVEAWFSEYHEYTFGRFGFEDNIESTGHYTQLIWAKTKYIGCGYNVHDNPDEDSKNAIEELYVCHYGPIGNRIGEFPYERTEYENY